MNRRAFTLLETMMAAAIGMVVVLTAVGIMSAMTRADTTLAKRAQQVTQLEVLHNVMTRAFTTLSMSEVTPPNQRVGRSGGGSAGDAAAAARTSAVSAANNAVRDEDGPAAAAAAIEGRSDRPSRPSLASIANSGTRSGAAAAAALSATGGGTVDASATTSAQAATQDASSDAASGNSAAPPPPPRFILSADVRPNQRPMTLRLTGERGNEQGAPQQLEVVLAKPPVSLPRTTTPDTAPANSKDAKLLPGTQRITTKSYRGIFELLPDHETARTLPEDDTSPPPLALWWRPLPATAPVSLSPTTEPISEPVSPPIKIADHLAFCRWQVFQDSKSQDQYTAIWAQQLPAYIEMEVQTTGGLYAKWMFEVDWVVQAETEILAPQDLERADGTSRKGAPGTVIRGRPNQRPGSGRPAPVPGARGTPGRPRSPNSGGRQ